MSFRPFVLSRFAIAPVAVAVLAMGCSRTPTAPHDPSEAGTPPAAWSHSTPGGSSLLVEAQVSPDQLTARGWVCLVPPPLPDRVVCRAPNQQFPSPTIPVDQRAPTFTLLVFDRAGTFIGTQIGIREDLYHGQTCESTGTSYIFRPPIGYYECVHTVGG